MPIRDEHNVSARLRSSAGPMRDRRAERGGDKAERRKAVIEDLEPLTGIDWPWTHPDDDPGPDDRYDRSVWPR